jgi:hypothetical protein
MRTWNSGSKVLESSKKTFRISSKKFDLFYINYRDFRCPNKPEITTDLHSATDNNLKDKFAYFATI